MSAAALAEVAAELGLGDALLLGKGEDASGGREKPSILADALEAVIGAVYLDGGWPAARALVLELLADRIDRRRRRPRRPGLQDPPPGARRPPVRRSSRLRGARRGPRPRQALLRRRAPVDGPRCAARARARRRSRPSSRPPPTRRLATASAAQPATRSRTARQAPAEPRAARTTMPELPEVETIRRELEREVVGKRIKTVEVTGTALDPAPRPRRQFIAPARGRQGHRRSTARASTCCSGSTPATCSSSTWHERPAAARGRPRTPVDKHTHVVITFTQGGQLRFVDPRTFGELFVATPDELDRGGARARRLGFDPVDEPISWTDLRPAAARPTDEAQGVPDGPVVHRRHRQHLLRRDPLRTPACATTARPTRCRPRRSAGCTGRSSRSSTRPSSTAARPSPTSSTSTSRQAGRVPGAPPGLRPRGQPAAGAGPRSCKAKFAGPLDLLLRAVCQV